MNGRKSLGGTLLRAPLVFIKVWMSRASKKYFLLTVPDKTWHCAITIYHILLYWSVLFYVDVDVDDDYGDGCLATVARGPRLHTLPEQADPAGFLLDTHPHDVDADIMLVIIWLWRRSPYSFEHIIMILSKKKSFFYPSTFDNKHGRVERFIKDRLRDSFLPL